MNNLDGECAIRHAIAKGHLDSKQKEREAERQRKIEIRKDKQDEQKYFAVEQARCEQAEEDTKDAIVELKALKAQKRAEKR